MIPLIDPDAPKFSPASQTIEEHHETVLGTLENKPPDQDLLEELTKQPVEVRLARLELEMERRLSEMAILTHSFRIMAMKMSPIVNQIHSHFFGNGEER